VAPNPDFGATITYHLANDYKSLEATRKAAEKKKKNEDIAFPGWEALEQEALQQKPAVFLVIKDEAGKVVRRIKAPAKKGIHRVAWDLRYPASQGIRSDKPPKNPQKVPKGFMVAPGQYSATLVKLVDGVASQLAAPQTFTVKPMRKGALEGSSPEATAAFWRELADTDMRIGAVNMSVKQTEEQLKLLAIAVQRSQSGPGALDKQLHELSTKLQLMRKQLKGDPQRSKVGEKSAPTIANRFGVARIGTRNSTYGPTPTHKENLAIAQKQLDALEADLKQLLTVDIPALEKALEEAKAPPVKGGGLR